MIRCWFRDHSQRDSPWTPAWLVSTPEASVSYPKCVIAFDDPASRYRHAPHLPPPPRSLQLRTVPLDEVRIKNPAMDIFTDPVRPDAATASEKSPRLHDPDEPYDPNLNPH